MRTRRTRMRGALALSAVLALTIAACGGDDAETGGEDTSDPATDTADQATDTGDTGGGGDAEPVTIEWWHIQNNDPGMSNWQAVADQFQADNPHVTINVTVMENEAFKAAIQT